MVNNKQVNIWRGDQTPPTIYHIWVKDNSKLLLYNGTQWVVFLDNIEIIDTINKIQESVEKLETQIDELSNKTVNNKPIKDNPILDGKDINISADGTFINSSETLAQTALRFDKLLTTQIIQ